MAGATFCYNKKMTLEKTNRMNLLLDTYAALLNDRQQEVLKQYYSEDFSLTEIADLSSLSKQAVSDLLKRSEKKLENFEKMLHLIEKENQRREIISKLMEMYPADLKLIQELTYLQDID